MQRTYTDYINAALDVLDQSLQVYVEARLKIRYKDNWYDHLPANLHIDAEAIHWDTQAILSTMINQWKDVFQAELGHAGRNYVGELKGWRNIVAHRSPQKPITFDDAYRAVDTTWRLLSLVPSAQAQQVREIMNELQAQNALPIQQAPPNKQDPSEPVQQEVVPKIVSIQPSPQPEKPIVLPASADTVIAEEMPLKTGRTIDFWGAYHFDFADALNEEIWLLSPDIQKQVQPTDTLKQAGIVGAQQAMLDSSVLAERGPLPWVPDLVGKEWQDESGIVLVGSAYAGFIREYSTRSATMPLSQYLAASSVQDFQNLFLRYVVRGDPGYYTPIQNLCSDLGSASRLSLVDLCRVSLVERGYGVQTRADNSSGISTKAPAVFEKYAESPQAAEWLWRRFADGQAKCVLALGSTAEHGLLRMFSHRGMEITQDGEPYFVPPIAQGLWTNEYADPSRTLGYWLKHQTWWTVQGQVNGTERVWYVLPIYHPARHGNYDADYKRTKAVLKLMQASARQ